MDDFFARERIESEVVMETENVEIIKAMVRNGLGISIIPWQAAVSRRAQRAADVQPHRRALARAADGMALSEDERGCPALCRK